MAGLLALSAVIASAACSSSGPSSSSSKARDPVELARSLHVCDAPKKSGTVAACKFSDGEIAVGALKDRAAAAGAASAADGSNLLSALIGDGWQVVGEPALLDAHLPGGEQGFAAKQHAVAHGHCTATS
jgi:hypothetical protein